MNRFAWLLLAAAAGCINGAPLPPTPVSSLARSDVSPDKQLQDAEFVQIAQTYIRGLGRDPTQATYNVRRTPQHEDDEEGEPATVAVVDVDFLNGYVFHLAVKDNGEIAPLTKH